MIGFLYGKTEYELLNNACHLDEYIELGVKTKVDFLSITDPNLYAHYKFYKACIKNNIKPIIGLEVKVKNDFGFETFLLYAKNNLGYHNLLKVCSLMNLKEELTLKDLLPYKDNIIFILSLNNSSFLNIIKQQEIDEAVIIITEYKKLLNDFYIGYSNQDKSLISYNEEIKVFARNFNVLTVYLRELKYLTEEDRICYETLSKIGKNDIKYGDYSFKIEENIDEELEYNTNYLINQINLDLFRDKIKMPKYSDIEGFNDSKDKLINLTYKGLFRRLKLDINSKRLPNYVKFYIERLKKELDIIINMGFQDYFLIVWNFINYSKKQNILVGPGRGSAASSLVAYSLGITEVDPLKYNLFFERFLNPERITMPDIDTDFPDDKREDVINYVKEFYGKNHVCSISTFGTFSKKSAIRDVCKVFNLDEKNIKEITSIFDRYDNVKDIYDDYKEHSLKDVIYTIIRLDKIPRNISVHAAGIIISDLNLFDYLPLQNGINNIYQSQLEACDLEELGFLKIDFLGLKNLKLVDNVLNKINKDYSYLRNIDLNDKKVLSQFTNKDTLGIFQFESDGMTEVLGRLKPENFNDLVAVIALYRPGPMDNIDTYIRRRHGEKFEFLHKDLEPILKDTYGIIIYQEQIMQIANKFAGYSLGAADVLRRAVSKKKLEVLEQERTKFVESSINNGYTRKVANEIYDYIVKFANYGFNKAHSVVYAMLSYQMAYLKCYHFEAFIAEILDNVIQDKNMLLNYIKYARKRNLKVYLPTINNSSDKFRLVDNKLYMPFNVINQITSKTSQRIVLERQKGDFKSLDDFLLRVDNIDNDQVHNMIGASVFDEFNLTKKEMIESKTHLKVQIDSLLKDIKSEVSEFDINELEKLEFEALGFNYKYSSLKRLKPLRQRFNIRANLGTIKPKYTTNLVVKIKDLTKRKTKNGNNYFAGTVYDEYEEIKFYLFDDIDESILSTTNFNHIYFISAKYKIDEKYGNNINILSINKVEEK